MLQVEQLAAIVLRPERRVIFGSKGGRQDGENQASNAAAERHGATEYRRGSGSSNGRRMRSPVKNLPSHLTRPVSRSEEHTSELQSQSNLVCRLLLEKK